MKTCFKCGLIKDYSEFYKHKGMADGHLNKCKTCTKSDVRERALRPEMIDIIREEKRLWARSAKGRQSQRVYSRSGVGKESSTKSKREWASKNKKKVACDRMVNNAVRDGFLKKPQICEICKVGSERIHGHHCDYNKPLDVMWMCPSCHSDWHRKNEPINGV